MTQDDVYDYVMHPDHGCEEAGRQVKDDGTYYKIRKKDGDRPIAIIYPVKSGTYTCGAVCHICNTLKIPVPEYGKHMQKVIDAVKGIDKGAE